MVLLHHTGGGRESHYDWLLSRVPGDPMPQERVLRAFRLPTRPDHPAVAEFEAEEMPDHRAHYLHFEGEMSGGRGTVKRAAEGACRVEDRAGALLVEATFGAMTRMWLGVHSGKQNKAGEPVWRFRLLPRE